MITRALGIVFVISVIWIFRPYSKPNPERVHPSFRQVENPIVEERFFYWKDGGSVGLKIVDSQGNEAMACCPRPLGEYSENLKKLFVGNVHYTFVGAVEPTNYPDTKLVVAKLLRERENPRLHTDRTAAELSGRWRDYARLLWRRFTLDDSYLSYDSDEAIY